MMPQLASFIILIHVVKKDYETRNDLKDSTRDGRLVVVSRDLTRCCEVGHIAPHCCRQPSMTGEMLRPDFERSPKASRQVRNPLRRFMKVTSARHFRVPTNGLTARLTSITSSWCERPATPRCRRASGAIL